MEKLKVKVNKKASGAGGVSSLTGFEQITDFNNLYAAYKAAAYGKHDRAEVLRHDLHAEKILWQLKTSLENGTYRHGKYRTFRVYDPKQRDVAAAPFTDRIVHHAIVRVIEPLFERAFIYDSYACRVGKGTHASVLRLQHFLRSATDKYGEFYILRADVRQFFASIDHQILLKILGRRLHDERLLRLLREVIGSYRTPPEADVSLSLSLSLLAP
jgi:RNA-directed DNA polymerase